MHSKVKLMADCKGQGLVEALIAISFLLMGVILLLPVLSKYVESRQATEQAARYMAWERTVWYQNAPQGTNAAVKSDAAMQREIHWRFFSEGNEALSSNDEAGDKDWSVEDNLIATLSTRQTSLNQEVSILATEEVDNSERLFTASVTDDDSPGLLRPVTAFLDLIDFGGFSVNTKGLYGSNIEYSFAELPGLEPFDEALAINPNSEVFILGDGWNTAGRSHTESKVQGLTWTSAFDTGFVDTLQNGLGWIPFAREIRPSSLRWGHVNTEPVPSQRLCQLRNNRSTRCRR